MFYISDHKEGRFQVEISGYLAQLSGGTYFVTGEADCKTIGEIINACGFTIKSVLNRRIVITIEDDDCQNG